MTTRYTRHEVETSYNSSEKSININKSLDPLDATVGSIGRWQIMICLSAAILNIPIAFNQLGIIFLAPPVNFTCLNPFGEENRCLENCTKYGYDSTIFNNSIIMEWDLVCSREWMKDMTQTIFMFGILIGNILFGSIADRYGRKIPLMIAIAVQGLTGLLSAYTWDWYSFTIIRFIQAIFCGGTIIIGFVLSMEIVGVKHRQLFSMIFQIPFNIGHAIMVGIAYLTRNSWSDFQFWLSAPTLLLIFYFWLIPESPRWLLTIGKISKAVDILKKGARMNNLSTEELRDKIIVYQCEVLDTPKQNILDLFKTPNIRCRTILLCFGWLACGICFFGVSQYIGQLFGNIFINVLISALIQLPGIIFVIFLNDRYGRKKTLILAYFVSGLPLVSLAFIPETWKITIVILSLIGIMGCSMNFPTIYLFSAEIFPTILRNTGMGLCSVLARCGSMIAPFVTSLNEYEYWIPPVIFGGIPLIAAILMIYLPETHEKLIPDTLEEAEIFGTNKSKS